MVIVTDAQNRLVGYLPLEEATEQFGEHLSCVYGFYKLDGTLSVEERQGWLRHSLESDELKDYQRDQVSEEIDRIEPFVASKRFARERAEAIERAKGNAEQRKAAVEEKAKEERAKAEQKKGSSRKAHTPVHPRRFHEEGGGVYLRTTRPTSGESRIEDGQARRGRKGKKRPSLSEPIWPTPKLETMKLSRPTPTPKAVSTDGSAGMSGQSTQGSFSADKAEVVASPAPKFDSTEVVCVYDSGHAFLGYFSRMTAKDEWGIALSDDPELTVSRGFSLKGRKDILKRSMGNPLLDKMQKALIHSELGNIDGIERARAQEAEQEAAERVTQVEAAAGVVARETVADAMPVEPVAASTLADGAVGVAPSHVEKDPSVERSAREEVPREVTVRQDVVQEEVPQPKATPAPTPMSADLALLREWAAAQARPVSLRADDAASETWFVANEIMHSHGDLLVFDEALYREVAGAELVDVSDPSVTENGVDMLNFPFPMAVIRLDGDRDFFGVAVFRTDGFRRSLGLPVGSSDRVSSRVVYIPRVPGHRVVPGIRTRNVAHKLMMYLNCEAISEQVVHRKAPVPTRKTNGGWDVSAAGLRASGASAGEVRARRGGDYETGVHVIVERQRGQVTHPRGRLKKSHFRRGYYGYVWVGPRGSQHREMRWHRPTFVHGSMSSLAEHRVVRVAL